MEIVGAVDRMIELAAIWSAAVKSFSGEPLGGGSRVAGQGSGVPAAESLGMRLAKRSGRRARIAVARMMAIILPASGPNGTNFWWTRENIVRRAIRHTSSAPKGADLARTRGEDDRAEAVDGRVRQHGGNWAVG